MLQRKSKDNPLTFFFERRSASSIALDKPENELSFPIGDKPKFSIERLIEKTLQGENVQIDLTIDDRHIPVAENVVEFYTSELFMAFDPQPWARQLEIAVKFFAEWCPRCTDNEWFNQNGEGLLSCPKKAKLKTFRRKVCLLEHGVCPKCGVTQIELLRNKELKHYNELTGVAGQRASKSTTVAMLSCYTLHRYLKLPRPTRVLGISSSTLLHGTFVALTFDQARQNLWDPFYNMVMESPWFKNYHAFLDQYQQDTGKNIYKLKDTFFLYRHRNLTIYPAGPNKKVLRGRTRFLSAIDELGWFDAEAESNKVKMNAKEVYIALVRSLRTVRNAAAKLLKAGKGTYVIPGLQLDVSSPSSRNDYIMKLYRDLASMSRCFGFKHATWEINPEIEKHDLADEYAANPQEAERDYGANPPLSSSPFFGSVDLVTKAMRRKFRSTLIQKTSTRLDGSRYSWGTWKTVPTTGTRTVCALDAGLNNNSFAFAIGSYDENLKGTVIHHIGEIIPNKGFPCNHSKMYSTVILPLLLSCNVGILASDRWNSIKVHDDAAIDVPGLKTTIKSIKYTDLVYCRDNLYNGQLLLPKPTRTVEQCLEYDPDKYPQEFLGRPADHLFLQLMTVQDTGHDVIKGAGLTDDIFRAVALCNAILSVPENRVLLNAPVSVKAAAGGGVVVRRGGATGTSMTSVGGVFGKGGRR